MPPNGLDRQHSIRDGFVTSNTINDRRHQRKLGEHSSLGPTRRLKMRFDDDDYKSDNETPPLAPNAQSPRTVSSSKVSTPNERCLKAGSASPRFRRMMGSPAIGRVDPTIAPGAVHDATTATDHKRPEAQRLSSAPTRTGFGANKNTDRLASSYRPLPMSHSPSGSSPSRYGTPMTTTDPAYLGSRALYPSESAGSSPASPSLTMRSFHQRYLQHPEAFAEGVPSRPKIKKPLSRPFPELLNEARNMDFSDMPAPGHCNSDRNDATAPAELGKSDIGEVEVIQPPTEYEVKQAESLKAYLKYQEEVRLAKKKKEERMEREEREKDMKEMQMRGLWRGCEDMVNMEMEEEHEYGERT